MQSLKLTIMKLKEAIETMKAHNKWRRGAETGRVSPKGLGVAIDVLINHAEQSLLSGGKSAEEVRIAADKWFSATEWIDADKNSFAAGAKWMQEQYAHQQPVQVQLCPKCNGEGKCFEIIIPTEYRVCPVCNGDKILYPPISQQPVIDGWRVYNTGVDITEQCTFESGVITINSNVVHRG